MRKKTRKSCYIFFFFLSSTCFSSSRHFPRHSERTVHKPLFSQETNSKRNKMYQQHTDIKTIRRRRPSRGAAGQAQSRPRERARQHSWPRTRAPGRECQPRVPAAREGEDERASLRETLAPLRQQQVLDFEPEPRALPISAFRFLFCGLGYPSWDPPGRARGQGEGGLGPGRPARQRGPRRPARNACRECLCVIPIPAAGA